MAVFRHRREGEELRLHFGFQVEHQANDARTIARHAQALDVGVFGHHFAVELGERRRQFGLEVENQPLRVLDGKDLDLQFRFCFEREPRVVARRPDAARDDLRLRACYREESERSQPAPASECASMRARRASPSYSSRTLRSGGGKRSPACSGHSTMQAVCGLK